MRSGARAALLAPAALWTLLFFAAPVGVLVVYSLGRLDPLTLTTRLGLTFESYARIADPLYLKAIGRSLLMSTGATLACLLVGFPVALAIGRQPPRRQTLLLMAVMVPFWTSFIVRTYGLVDVLDDRGPVAGVLRSVGLVEDRLGLLYTPWGVALGLVYAYLPLMILPLYIALERIGPELGGAAGDLGATPRRTLLRVTIPLARPGIVAGCVMVGIPATGEYVVPAILGGEKTLMYGNVVANQFLGAGDYPFGSALAVTLMASMTAVLLVFHRQVAESGAVA